MHMISPFQKFLELFQPLNLKAHFLLFVFNYLSHGWILLFHKLNNALHQLVLVFIGMVLQFYFIDNLLECLIFVVSKLDEILALGKV
jgi:hypothetical protein